MVNASMPPSRQEEGILHEIFEAINYHLEVELEHNKLCAISEVLYMIIRDNKLFNEK